MEENKKVSIFEKISLRLRKKWLTSTLKTWILAIILIVLFLALNMWVKTLDLPEIDITQNKIYTLSDASKDALKSVEQDIHIYAYGFNENSSLINFLKQYNKANPKITYEVLTEETNPEMIKANDLSEGYMILILESGKSKKVIDAQNEFYSYDYTTFQQIDTTEQTITNAILALNIENKPNVYFLQGHEEFSSEEITSLKLYLTNEAYETHELNLINTNKIPEDCDLLAILSPSKDLLEVEVPIIEEYINRGGNIIFSQDMLSGEVSFPNIQKILDLYGVSVKNGYIVETDSNYSVEGYPYIFMPHVSAENEITRDIYTDSYMILVYASKLNIKSNDELATLNVSREDLLTSGEKSFFISDLNTSIDKAKETAEIGSSTIASLMTKNISGTKEEGNLVQSKLLISAVGAFISDYSVSSVESQAPLSALASNKDFMLNSIAYLTDREGTLTIRKDMANSTYAPTQTENRIVLTVIFLVPILIILAGIFIWNMRKKRK